MYCLHVLLSFSRSGCVVGGAFRGGLSQSLPCSLVCSVLILGAAAIAAVVGTIVDEECLYGVDAGVVQGLNEYVGVGLSSAFVGEEHALEVVGAAASVAWQQFVAAFQPVRWCC